MKRNGIIFGFLLSSFAGAILGASAGFFLLPAIFPPPRPGAFEKGGGSPPLPSVEMKRKMMNRLEHDLVLTATQKGQVEKEVALFTDELGQFHDANREKLKSMFDVFSVKLAGLLSKEQAVKLERIMREVSKPPPPEKPGRRRDDDNRPPPQASDEPPPR